MGPTHQRVDDIAVARGLARPPLLFLACLALGFALDRLLPLPLTFAERLPWSVGTAGGGLIVVGLVIVAAGIRNFFNADTPVPSNQPVRALVTTGIHGWSRNPIYVGMLLLYAGIGVAARSPLGPHPRGAYSRHPALRRGRARRSVSRAPLRRRLPRLQGASSSLAVDERPKPCIAQWRCSSRP